jgi:SAM-dependent methyltransferase
VATEGPGRADVWASGAAYEPYVGRWSRLVAREFLSWLAVPPGGRWLDVGCGTGALVETILALAEPARVTGVEPSEGYIAYAREHIRDPRTRFVLGDAQTLAEADKTYDVTVSGLVLNFVLDPARAVAEMARVTREDGTVAAYVWDYAGQMQLMRYFWDAAVALDPAASSLDEGIRFPLCHPEALTSLFEDAGLRAITVRAIDAPTVFRDFDDYWNPFLGGQGPAPGYAMSLDEGRRGALRERIRAALPTKADGSIPLVARAWAVRGVR